MIAGTTLATGTAEGPVLALAEPLSFWGGYDAATGCITDRWHPDHGRLCSGHVLVMRASRGSSSGSSVLAEAIRAGTAPAAIILAEADAILTVGAMVAAELYGRACPVVVVSPSDLALAAAATRLHVEARAEGAALLLDGEVCLRGPAHL
jgi:predicted aconitase with swiveling domain